MKNSTRSIIPALLAVGGGLASTPAAAIELGDINVQSTLGQPLRASIAYALGPNEQIASYCVSLKPGFANDGLPAVNRANIRIANGVIALTGVSVIREPLMTVRLDISCPYTPKLSREYMLFIDPARPAQAPQVAAPVAAAAVARENAAAPVTSTANTRTPDTRRTSAAPSRAPIDASTSYRVQPGDSLSLIAQRIENRPVGLWSAVAQIFDANPDAFLNNDPNQLKAGSLLVMPNFGSQATFAEAPATEAAPVAAAPVTESEPASDAVDYDAAFADLASNAPAEAAATSAADATLTETSSAPVAEPATPVDETTVEDDTRVLQPGDVILDTTIDVPTPAANPNVATANIITDADTGSSNINWLVWLIGVGAALIAGLFVFGRRGRYTETPAPSAAHPMRRATDGNTEELEAVPDPFYEIEDDSPTEENLALDANLEIGTGLQEGTEVDVAQDFGFAATTDLDLELPDERDAQADKPETDIISPPQIEPESILESEVLPDDDDYDMSVIVDATKMPVPEEVTERDLKAVVVDSGDETLIADNYTVSKEVDYDILEQDYEEELSATQALNIEIERAAAEITERMETGDRDDVETSQMPLATVTEIDVTANLQAASADDDETAVFAEEKTEELLAEDKTVEMPASDGKKTG